MIGPQFTEFANFADEVARLRGRIRELFAETRSYSGLAEMELTVLTAVTNAATPPTAAQIGRSLGHPRQVVQRAANRLAEIGLIAFRKNPDHKRASLLVATAAGQELKSIDHQRSEAVTQALYKRVAPAEFADAANRLHAIRAKIEAMLREMPA